MIRRRWLVNIDIERRAGDLALFDRLGEISFIDNSTARAVNDAHAPFHFRESRFIDEPLGVRSQWHMDGDKIGFGKNILETRSEERRVGKECSPWVASTQYKQNRT